MGADYHYSRGGQSFGPVSVEHLKDLAAKGQLSATDLVWKEGMADWVPAGRFKGLIPAAPAAQAAAVPSSAAPSDSPSDNPPSDDSHEFRFSEPAPAPVIPPSVVARPSVKSEPVDDATQAEVFARQAKEVALAAGTDALKAFKTLAKNPVGGLRTAYEALGPTRAMQVGIVFAILFELCFVFAGYRMLLAISSAVYSGSSLVHSPSGHDVPGSVVIKLIVIGCVIFGSIVGGFAAARAIFKGQGTIQSDMFVAGASLLPAVVLSLASLILGWGNYQIIFVVLVFAVTTTVLILYSGCTTLQCIPDAAATLVVPLMLVFDALVCEIVLRM